jgi:hypothetical protein
MSKKEYSCITSDGVMYAEFGTEWITVEWTKSNVLAFSVQPIPTIAYMLTKRQFIGKIDLLEAWDALVNIFANETLPDRIGYERRHLEAVAALKGRARYVAEQAIDKEK